MRHLTFDKHFWIPTRSISHQKMKQKTDQFRLDCTVNYSKRDTHWVALEKEFCMTENRLERQAESCRNWRHQKGTDHTEHWRMCS